LLNLVLSATPLATYVYADDECPANGGVNARSLRGCVDVYGVQMLANRDARGCGVRRRGDDNVRA